LEVLRKITLHADNFSLLLLFYPISYYCTNRLGTNLSSSTESEATTPVVGLLGSASGIGKYVASSSSTQPPTTSTQKRKAPSTTSPLADSVENDYKKKKAGKGFGDFSSW